MGQLVKTSTRIIKVGILLYGGQQLLLSHHSLIIYFRLQINNKRSYRCVLIFNSNFTLVLWKFKFLNNSIDSTSNYLLTESIDQIGQYPIIILSPSFNRIFTSIESSEK